MTYTPREKRTYEAMYAHTASHARIIKETLKRVSRDDEAHTLHEAFTEVSSDRIARYLARALATKET